MVSIMRRSITTLLAFALISASAQAQTEESSNRLQRYRQGFVEATTQIKLALLQDSLRFDATEMAPLYADSLSYVVSNTAALPGDKVLLDIANLTVPRLIEGRYAIASYDLWRYFRSFVNVDSRVMIAGALAELADDNIQVVDRMGQWVITQNNLRRAGNVVELQVIAAMTSALGNLGHDIVFPAVMDVILTEYPAFVSDTATSALMGIDGDPLELSASFLLGLEVTEREVPFRYLLDSGFLSEVNRLKLAERILNSSLGLRVREYRLTELNRRVRFEAADVLRRGRYGEATPVVIRHFNETLLEYGQDQIAKYRLIEAIEALGAMGTEAAATRLAEYLDWINVLTDNARPFDTQIVLVTIENLRRLGFDVAVNPLFSTTLLDIFPERVLSAARGAMNEIMQ